MNVIRKATVAAAVQQTRWSSYKVPGVTVDQRRASLKKKIAEKGFVRAIEAHSGLTGLIAEHAVGANGEKFDATWSSSLTSSSVMGKPDIEVVDTTARLRICDEVMDVTSLPMIYDGDTGGPASEIFHFTVKNLERMGVSACIIEDKTGLKQNSLFGTERKQQLADIDEFSEKIARGKAAQVTDEFMIFARLEALIAGYGHDEAMLRARAFLDAGADGVMIHSKEKEPHEIYRFLEDYNKLPNRKMVVVVPTTYNSQTEQELHERGASIVIHANQMLRAAYPAMMGVAEKILTHGRSLEADKDLLSVKQILNLIDDGTGKTN